MNFRPIRVFVFHETLIFYIVGRRTEKKYSPKNAPEQTKVTKFVWDGNTPLHEWVETTERSLTEIEKTTWVFDADSFVPSAKLVGDKSYSIVSDYLGTPCQAYTETGAKVWEYEQKSYGGVESLTGAINFIPFRYQGQYEDVETGLYYNRFRYYSPDEGAYISQDLIRISGGLKLYEYAKNPLFFLDIFGLEDIVYRATSKNDIGTMNQGEGISPKNGTANATPLDHVLHGSTDGYGDQYISVTRDKKFAERWAKKNGTEVVEIDLDKVPGKKIDLSTAEGRKLHLGDASRHDASQSIKDANRMAKNASEVLVEGKIPQGAITRH